jgi:calmodulin
LNKKYSKLFQLNSLFSYVKAYKLFDKDGSGTIEIQEIGLVLRNLGLFPTEKELNQMLNDIDIDGDNLLAN